MQNTKSEHRGQKPINIDWLAGFLDGEGCFLIKGNLPLIKVNSCNYDILCKICDVFGGKIYNHGKAEGNRRASWSWHLSGQPARDLAKLLLNLLHEKHTQALSLLAFTKDDPDEVKKFLKNDKRKHYEHLRR